MERLTERHYGADGYCMTRSENCKAYGGYVSSVEDVAEAKRELAKQAARCVERAMLDNDMFLVDGSTVSWKLLLYRGEGGT